jgi:hypothetical protein
LFSSIEVEPNFANTGKAYLLGTAVTNTPASLGTEMMKFCASQGEANPLANRKKSPTSLFTASHEITLEFGSPAASIPGAAEGTTGGLIEIIKALLPFSQQKPNVQTPAPAPEAAVVPLPAQDFSGLTAAILAMAETQQRENASFRQQIDASNQRFSELIARLESSEASSFSHRPPPPALTMLNRSNSDRPPHHAAPSFSRIDHEAANPPAL